MLVRLALVSFAWLLAACGDGDDGGDQSNAADQESADEAIAAVEQSLRDGGFSAADDEDGDGDDDDDDDLSFESDECQEFDEAFSAGGGASFPGETASAETDTFELDELAQRGVAESVNASVEFVEDQDQLDVVDEMLNDERLETCFEEAFRIGFEDTGDEGDAIAIGDVQAEKLASQGLGDGGGGVQVTAELTAEGVTLPIAFGLEVARVERAAVSVFSIALGPGQPSADRAELLQILVDSVSEQSS